MIYELRIYYIHPGRMENIHKRFSEVTLELFKKHNIRTVDFWEDAEGKNIIYYLLEHDDIDSRNRNFNSFGSDPDWLKAKELSQRDGPIVERTENFFMTRVPYSPAR